MNYDALEESITQSIMRMGKSIGRVRQPIKKVGVPAAGVVAGVGAASGAFMWHLNKEDQRRYGAR